MTQASAGTQSTSTLLQSFSSTVRGIDSSHQLAMGMALGVVAGLLPKDNLLFVGVVVFMILSGANLLTGALTCVGSSFLAPMIVPVAHSVGKFVLGLDLVQSLVAQAFQLPLSAWTRLDNTVVSGSFTISIIAFLPVYLISYYLFKRYRDFLHRAVNNGRVVNWFLGYTPQGS